MPRKTPFSAARFASLKFFSPRLLLSSALIPTPVPVETAIIRLWIGKAKETAVSASSPIIATNILSTTLYKACTSMDITIGRDIVINNLLIGITPILFSCCTSSIVILLFWFCCVLVLLRFYSTKDGAGWGRKGLAGTGAAEKGTESRAGAQTSQAGNRFGRI